MTTARIAGAPISWGVCEVPGWGLQLPADRVLEEMRMLGLEATELGPPGFLDPEPAALAEQLAGYGLTGVGGFRTLLLHDPGHDPLPDLDTFIDACLVSRAGVVVLAAGTGRDGYETGPRLDPAGWRTLLTNLDRITRLAADRGVVVALHPHAGTMVENGAEVARVLDGSDIGLCVDTGHLVVGGADPVALTRDHVDRVRHVHLKDVDGDLAAQVRAGTVGFAAAVRAGLWMRLGTGAVDVAAMIRILREHGYSGWYVLEQDVMLDAEPAGAGPVTDVEACLEYVREALA